VCDSGGFTHQGVILRGLVCDFGSFAHRGVQGGRKKRLWDEEEKTENGALRFAREKVKFVRLTHPLTII
jgi:hypothetical protein